MKELSVNNHKVSVYQDGEIQITCDSRIVKRQIEFEEDFKVYLRICDLKELLRLAEESEK